MRPQSFKAMHDTLGARIMTFFLSDLGLLHDFLTRQESLEIKAVKASLPQAVADELGLGADVAVETPPSGYASIHYRVRLDSPAPGASENPIFEIQVRTLIEDAWAEIEHLVGYKREGGPGDVASTFQILSQNLGAIDRHFDLLNSSMRSAQDDVIRPPRSRAGDRRR